MNRQLLALLLVSACTLLSITNTAARIVSLNGIDHLAFIARPTDTITLVAASTLDGQPIADVARTRIVLERQGIRTPFTSCSIGPDYQCTFTEKIVSEHGDRAYTVVILDADGHALSTETQFLSIDSTPPAIVDIHVQTLNTTQITIHAQDYSTATGDTSSCSGLSSITITDDGRAIQTIPAQGCDFTTTKILTGLTTSSALCISAQDTFGQKSSPVCQDIKQDNSAPVIDQFGYATSDGTFLTTIPASGRTLYPAIHITTGATKITSVIGDFSAQTGKPNDRRQSIFSKNNTYFFDAVPVTATTPCKAIFTITNELGKSLTEARSCELHVDTTPPVFLRLDSGYRDVDDRAVMGRQSQLTVHLRDQGLATHQLFLDLTKIGASRIEADSCTLHEDWQCIFNISLSSSSKDGSHFISISGTDDAGNTLAPLNEEIIVSAQTTQITSIEQSPLIVTGNDEVTYVVHVNGPSDLKLQVDASEVSSARFPQDGACELQNSDGEWTCVVIINSLSPTPVSGTVHISVTDPVGGSASAEQTLRVYQTGDANTSNQFILQSVTTTPDPVDRSLLSQIAYPVSIHANLKARTAGLEIADSVVHCDEILMADAPRLVFGTTLSPTILFKLDSSVATNGTDTLRIPCQLDLVVKNGDVIYPRHELLNFTANIHLANAPLGRIDERIQSKLAGIDQDINHIQNQISDWQDINKALGTVRDASSLIAQTDALLSIATSVLWGVANILFHLPVSGVGGAGGAGASLWQGNCALYVGSVYPGIHEIINLAFWYPGHLPGSILLPAPKTATLIYSCQLCGFSNYLRVAIPPQQGNIIANLNNQKGKPTLLDAVTTYTWEPFKSIHIAQACFCPPAIEYNLRKERQVRCIYRNCVRDASALGLPYDNCDRTLLEQNCLYVDGAAWKIAGGAALASTLRDLTLTVLSLTPVMAAGDAWTATCAPFLPSALGKQAYNCMANGADPLIDYAVPVCGLWAGILEPLETDFFGKNRFGWDTLNGQLGGEDFCSK